MADSDDQVSRSRSQSRRRRRQNQRQRIAASRAEVGGASADSMAAVQEEADEEQARPKPQLKNPATADTTEMQPFERIKPPSQSMDGPVTFARAMRGEIPMRGAPPSQPYSTTQGVDAQNKKTDILDQDGMKVKLELNLDIEIELKASIHGDLTLAIVN